MKDKYQKELKQIHAPRELIEQTKQAMRKEAEKEQKRIKFTIVLKRSALASAALIIIAVGGYGYYSSQNQINVASVVSTSFSIDPNFGKVTESKEPTSKDKITLVKGPQKELIPDFLVEVKPSKIKGVAIKLGRDDKGVYHAAYQLAEQYYYVVGKKVSEAEFITYLKKQL